MLGKLLKYDLKWCYKPLLVFYILAIFFSIVVRIVESFEQTLIWLIIDKICCGVVIAMIINILINCFMRNWARFVRNMYKDESYLTHTLPVKKTTLYLSKALTSAITLATSLLVIVACLAIAALNKDTWDILKYSLEQMAAYFNSSVFGVIFTLVIIVFLEFLCLMLSGILGIILGHKSNNLKIVKSVIYGFVIYMALSCVSLGLIYIIAGISPDIMAVFNEVTLNANGLKSVVIICALLYALYSGVIYMVSSVFLNKGVDLE